jgi:hypothetical protein
MTGHKEVGLQEQVQKALLPLTHGGEFQFETIKYDIHFGVFEFRLHSEKIDIIFSNKLIFQTDSQEYITQNVEFFQPSVKKTFRGEFLFSALRINILFRDESPLRGIREGIHIPGSSWARPQVMLLLEDATVFPGLKELCETILQNLPVIYAGFSKDKIDETILLYEQAIEKSKNPGDRYNVAEYERYTRTLGYRK